MGLCALLSPPAAFTLRIDDEHALGMATARASPVSASSPGSRAPSQRQPPSASRVRGRIREVVLKGPHDASEQRLLLYALNYLRRELGWDGVRAAATLKLPELTISLHDWEHAAVGVEGFDRLLASEQRRGDFRLVLSCSEWLPGTQAAMEVLNRYQRLLPLPRDYVPMPRLAGVLAVQQLLFRGRRQNPREPLDVAHDTWRWLLRLSCHASPALQLAALFHDAAPSPPAESAEPWSSELRALGSVRAACRGLEPLALPQPVILRMSQLILQLDDAAAEPDAELMLLRDARDLAFFSSSSDHTLDEQGTAQTFITVTHCLQRMSDAAVCLALTTRQPPLIEQIIESALDSREEPEWEAPAGAAQRWR